MYKIIGADGKEYGPVSAEQLRQWIAQGRVNPATKVKDENAADWQVLGTMPEFVGNMSTPPPLSSASDSTTGAPKTSGLAITSLVLGILGPFSCGVTALFGLVFGIVGHNKIKKSKGRLSGSGLAISGIVLSAIFILVMPLFFAAMLLPALSKAKAKAQGIHCKNNARQITLGIILYANDNTNACPRAENWCDAILSDVGTNRIFQCKAATGDSTSHFSYNKKLDGFDLEKIKDAATTVMIFESDGGWNSSGGSELLLQKPRHARTVVVGFADGHVEMVNESQLSDLNWEP